MPFPLAADILVVVLAAEAALLALRGRHVLLPTVLSGFLLVLAFRLSFAAVPPAVPLAVLAAAGLAHALDIRQRLRPTPTPDHSG